MGWCCHFAGIIDTFWERLLAASNSSGQLYLSEILRAGLLNAASQETSCQKD